MALLHSNIIGEGTPLLILHGLLGMSDNWKTLGKAYAEKGIQVHLIDQRNHGRSFHADEFDYSHMAQDVIAYCNHYQLNTVKIIGHSMGGKTAMNFATEHPDRVDKLLIADIAPKWYPIHHQTILNGLNAINFDSVNSRGMADQELAKHIPEIGVRQFLLKSLYWKDKDKLAFRFNLPSITKHIGNVGEALKNDVIFEKETLFLRGGNSDYVKDEDYPNIKKHFPKASLDKIENTGHWLHAENPKTFFEKSETFLID